MHPFWQMKVDRYSLSVDLGAPSEERTFQAQELLWEHPAVTGPFQFLDRPPSGQPVWTPAARDARREYRGIVRFGAREAVPFSVIVHRLDGVAYDVFALYIGSDVLGRTYPEIDRQEAPQPWYAEVNPVLASIARQIYARLNCSRAVIGWELLVLEEHLLKDRKTRVEEDGVLQCRPGPDELKYLSKSGTAQS
jgi:hypothetical protein